MPDLRPVEDVTRDINVQAVLDSAACNGACGWEGYSVGVEGHITWHRLLATRRALLADRAAVWAAAVEAAEREVIRHETVDAFHRAAIGRALRSLRPPWEGGP